MKNEQIFKKPKLIHLLIEYVKVNKDVFPIDRVKYLSNEEVIEILNEGTKKAQIAAKNTMCDVKKAMKINYFAGHDGK